MGGKANRVAQERLLPPHQVAQHFRFCFVLGRFEHSLCLPDHGKGARECEGMVHQATL